MPKQFRIFKLFRVACALACTAVLPVSPAPGNCTADGPWDWDSANAPRRLQTAGQAAAAVAAVLEWMNDRWNAHDLESYLSGFSKASVRVTTPEGAVLPDWRALHEHCASWYARPAAMGRRTIARLQVRMLSPERAVARTEWVFSPGDAGPGRAGVEEACLQREDSGWKIVEACTRVLAH